MKPIRKLNKRLIYWGLFGLVSLSVPALVSLASSKEKRKPNESRQHNSEANLNNKDSVMISGMTRFPETYEGVKEFEAEISSNKSDEAQFEDALVAMESKDT